MRRLALIVASLLASAVLALLLVPVPRASALTTVGPNGGLHNGAAGDNAVQLVRRGGGFRGGGFHGGRGFAFRGRGFHGGRAFAFRGGPGFRGRRAFAFRGGPGFRGRRAFAFRAGPRAFAFRAGPRRVWHRGWHGRGWGWGWGVAGAPLFYSSCPLVRRTVWTPWGWRVRWVRRCW